MRALRAALPVAYALLTCACVGNQSVLNPRGLPGFHLKVLTLGTLVVCGLVWSLVMAFLLISFLAPHSATPQAPAHRLAKARRAIRIACAMTVLIIVGLTIASFVTTRMLNTSYKDALKITVRGEQWWWRVRYGEGDATFETANEIHIPTERNVLLTLESGDVIHSFWVPNLAGKQDLIPGRINTLTIRAEQSGLYRGQCAEFCGLQHAHMAFEVMAQSPSDYAAWEKAQRSRALLASTEESRVGETVFKEKSCAGCHSIRGVISQSANGPDLTHVGSRRTIGAGLFETSRGSLAAWIADPQTLKPGNNMPLIVLSAGDLRAVSAYLAELK